MKICQPKAGNNISIVGSGRRPEGPHTQFLYPIYLTSVCLLPSFTIVRFGVNWCYLAENWAKTGLGHGKVKTASKYICASWMLNNGFITAGAGPYYQKTNVRVYMSLHTITCFRGINFLTIRTLCLQFQEGETRYNILSSTIDILAGVSFYHNVYLPNPYQYQRWINLKAICLCFVVSVGVPYYHPGLATNFF